MNLSALFKEFLNNQSNPPSGITIKNYISDVNRFIRWFEAKFNSEFIPSEITPSLLEQFKSESLQEYSASSVDRSASSLRKFFSFLKLEGHISHTPFEIKEEKRENDDPWKIRDFKNHLYVFGASHLTIKNYIIDAKQFLTWVDLVVKNDRQWDLVNISTFSKINPQLIEEYKNRLLTEAHLSPLSVNRKLSSIRRFINWAIQEGLINNDSGFENITNSQINQIPNANSLLNNINNYQSESKETSKSSYSKIPPIRLAQKLKTGAIGVLDSLVTAPVAQALEKTDALAWNLKGNPVFKEKVNLENKIPVPSIIDPKKINNIPKSFYSPATLSTLSFPLHKKIWHHARHSRPKWYKTYHTYAFSSYLHFSILMFFISVMGYFVFQTFTPTKEQPKTLAALPTSPPRILSFQGRLTDSSDSPITKKTNLRMSIYNSPTSSGSALLWQEIVSPTPDSEGIFSIILGTSTPIPQSLFAQNSGLWLGVTVERTEELKPRQQLATVAYASNSETLQGLPPITNTTSTSNVVLALNSSGNLTIGGTASPTFQATGGTFTLLGKTLALTTSSNGNIKLSPNGTGVIDIQKSIQNTSNNGTLVPGSVTIEDLFSVIATSSGQAVLNISQGSSGDLIMASTSGNLRFRVDNAGNLTANGTINGLSINSGTIDSGTWHGVEIGAPYGGTGQTSYTTGDMLYASDSTVISKLGIGANGSCLTSTGTVPVWTSCITASGGGGLWNQSAGVLFPNNSTVDFLVGGQSTESARFALINVNGSRGSQIASLSGSIILDSNNANVQATNNQTLTFGGSSTGLIQIKNNANNIFTTFDTVNSRLGIGTTTPGYIIDVVNSGDASIRVKDSSNSLEGIITTGGSTLDIGSITNHPVVLYTNNTTRLRLSANGGLSLGSTYSNTNASANDLLIEGNVGIGTTSPTANLDVNGTASLSGGLTFYGTPTIQSSAFKTLTFGGNITGNINLEARSTANSGYVLIGSAGQGGVSNPDFLVIDQASGALPTPVNGALAMDSTGKFNIYENGQWKVLCNKTDETCGTGSGSALSAITAAAGGNTINNGDNAQAWNWSISTNSKSAFTFGENIASTGSNATILKVSTIANSTAFPFQVEAQGNNVLSIGNTGLIGINTTSPLASLDIRSRVGTLPTASISGATSLAGLVVDQSGNGDIFTASKGGATRFVIANDGNVGIGTANPQSKLEIAGVDGFNLRLTPGTGLISESANLLINNRATFGYNGTLQGVIISDNTSEKPIIFQTAGIERLRIGQNLTNPSASISGGSSFASLVVDNSGSGDIFTASKSGDSKFVIKNNGNVGIGTTIPDATLEVGGSGSGSYLGGYRSLAVIHTANQSPWGLVFRNDTAGANKDTGIYLGNDGTFNIDPGDGAGDSVYGFAIAAVTGNVGIGTNTQTSALYVTHPLAQIANGKALAIFDQIENQDILTASAAGSTRFTITNNGSISFAGGQSVLTTIASANTIARTITIPQASGSDTFCLATLSNCFSGATTNYWQLNNNAVFPINGTYDILFGGPSTTSAKFAFLNNAGGTPTASISANSGNIATFITGAGNLGTTNGQTLTLGGSTTGLVNVNNKAGSPFVTFDTVNSRVGIGTSTPSETLEVTGNIIMSQGANRTFSVATTTSNIDGNNLSITAGAAQQSGATSRDGGDLNLSGGLGYNAGSANFGGDVNITSGLPGGNNASNYSGSINISTPVPTNGGTGNISLTTGSGYLAAGSITLATGTSSCCSVSGAIEITQGGISRLYVDGTVARAGNIGIGTNSPDQKFEILAGGGNTQLRLTSTDSSVYSDFKTNQIGNLLITPSGGNATIAAKLSVSTLNSNASNVLCYDSNNILSTCSTGTFTTGANLWQLSSNAISPSNSTYDVLFGSTASSTAKFAFLNNAGGTPTASISANSGNNATYITGAGNIQTTNRQSLTLGGSTTGSIILSPLNSGSGAQVIPGADNLVSLGASSSARYKDLFLGPSSLHVQCTTGDGCTQNLDYASGINTSTGSFYIGANGRSGSLNQLLTLTQGGSLGLKTGGTYQINGTDVLSATSLGSGVTSSSLTSLGTLTSLAANGTVDLNTSGSSATNIGTSSYTGTITIGRTSSTDLALNDANWSISGAGAASFASVAGAGTGLTGTASSLNIGGSAGSVVATVTGTNSTELVRGNMADNDNFRILVGGTGSNAGYAEIATADDGTEPIYVRQYTGVFTSLTRTATLLDASGNTSFPGSLTSTTLDTGQGANELYDMNQNVQTSDAVTFAGLTSTSTLNQSGGYAYLGSYNTNGTTYPSSGTALAVGWNWSAGGRDMTFFNTDTAATTSFNFRQLTGASASTSLMTLSSGGNVTFAGYINSTDSIQFTGGQGWSIGQDSVGEADNCTFGSGGQLCFGNGAPRFAIDTSGDVRGASFTNDATPDVAEGINVTDISIEAGDIVTAEEFSNSDPDIYEKSIATKSTKAYSNNVIGAISEDPGVLINAGFKPGTFQDDDTRNIRPLTIAGRVPVKVSTINGEVKTGDSIVTSDIPGIGMKSTKAGRVLGTALTDYIDSEATQSSKLVNGVWQTQNGACSQGEADCYNFKKVLVLIDIGWNDPDVQLTSAGDLSIAPSVNNDFEVKRQSGETISRIGAFSDLFVARIKAGYLEVGRITTETLLSASANISQLSTDSLAISTENVTIAGQTLRNYIASIVEDVIGQKENTIIVAPILSTDVISPKTGNDLAIKLKTNDKNSKLDIQNASGSAVASIDAEGNASFSGRVLASDIHSNNASFSGTLRAGRIIADNIEGLNITASTVSANYITNNYYYSTPSGSENTSYLANNPVSSGSGNFNNLFAMRATFEQGLMAFGPASFYEASVADRLFVGSRLSLADSSINVLGGDLELQPLKQGGIAFVGGEVKIDTDGNLRVNGNAYFAKDLEIKGDLFASLLSPLPGRDFVIKLGKRDENESANHDSSFVIKDASSSALLSVNNKGDLNASGAGTFNKLNISLVNKALAISPTEVIATGSAGTAEIAPNREELTVKNPLVTKDSLIYITAKTSTSNESVYLLRQVPGESFTVGISSPINKKVPFNWIIIN